MTDSRCHNVTYCVVALLGAVTMFSGCGGDSGGSATCVDFDAENPPFETPRLVALSETVPDLPEGFEADPPVPEAFAVENVSAVTAVDVGISDLEVENGVSVVLTGNLTVSEMFPAYSTLVRACGESGTVGDAESDFRSLVGFTGDRAVRFHLEEGRLTVSEYDG